MMVDYLMNHGRNQRMVGRAKGRISAIDGKGLFVFSIAKACL
jgi:hypothetical protein